MKNINKLIENIIKIVKEKIKKYKSYKNKKSNKIIEKNFEKNHIEEQPNITEKINFPSKTPLENQVKFIEKPFIFYVKNKIDKLLKEKLFELQQLNLTPKIGLEIEFYSVNKIKNIDEFFNIIIDFTDKNDVDIQNIEKERGYNQFEIQLRPYTDIKKLINDYELLKNFLLNLKNYEITFKSNPFYYEVGSALQINISLLNEKQENLFARVEYEGVKQESKLLKNCVAGLLKNTNVFLPLYINSSNCLKRYDRDFCEIFYNQGKMPSPVFNCWGVNNRTCSIRIPVPKNFNDFENYELEDRKNRRIEFRVPSSDANIKFALFGVLESLLIGIEYNLMPIEPTTNNVLKDNFGYEEIRL